MGNIKHPLITVVGPTAVGKTALSIRLAKQLDGEIISGDSRLFYRGMDIGTAKPSLAEMEEVPHHLIDVAEPDQEWSLARYLPEVDRIIADIHQRGKMPMLVGGTGQYIQAVTEGWNLPDIKPNPALRDVLEKWAIRIGADGLRARLEVLDPEASANIDGPNLRRLIRALEVILTSGKKFSSQKSKTGSDYQVLMIGLIRPRDELYQRIDQRIDQMLDQGLVQEVQELLEAGYSPDLSSMSAIGYKQIVSYLQREISLDEALRHMRTKTRKYVRQQANWFRSDDPEISWYDANGDPFERILEEIQHFLSLFCYTG
jgi:tRNA dimethylallyltransferase